VNPPLVFVVKPQLIPITEDYKWRLLSEILRNVTTNITSSFHFWNGSIIPFPQIVIKDNFHFFLEVFSYFSSCGINFIFDSRKHFQSCGCRSLIDKTFNHLNTAENSTFQAVSKLHLILQLG